MSTIGERLRLERERLGLNQTELGERCGVQKRSQINYEKDERSPDALYLVRLGAAGADVGYVLFGRMSEAAVQADEQRLLTLYRLAGSEVRRAVLAALAVGDVPSHYRPVTSAPAAVHVMEPAPGVSMTVHGKVGQQMSVKEATGATFSVDMGRKGRPD